MNPFSRDFDRITEWDTTSVWNRLLECPIEVEGDMTDPAQKVMMLGTQTYSAEQTSSIISNCRIEHPTRRIFLQPRFDMMERESGHQLPEEGPQQEEECNSSRLDDSVQGGKASISIEQFNFGDGIQEEEFLFDESNLSEASVLNRSFSKEQSYMKATNIGKFLIRIFLDKIDNYQRFVEDNKDKPAKIAFIHALKKQLEKSRNKTRIDMFKLFGSNQNDRPSGWAAQRRLFMQLLLSNEENRRKYVLTSNYIKPSLKVHYLYSLRVYEWRLNDERLIGHFN